MIQSHRDTCFLPSTTHIYIGVHGLIRKKSVHITRRPPPAHQLHESSHLEEELARFQSSLTHATVTNTARFPFLHALHSLPCRNHGRHIPAFDQGCMHGLCIMCCQQSILNPLFATKMEPVDVTIDAGMSNSEPTCSLPSDFLVPHVQNFKNFRSKRQKQTHALQLRILK